MTDAIDLETATAVVLEQLTETATERSVAAAGSSA